MRLACISLPNTRERTLLPTHLCPSSDARVLCTHPPHSHTGIVQAIEKLQKKCIVRFTETDMHIICASDVNEGGIQVWSYVHLFLCCARGVGLV